MRRFRRLRSSATMRRMVRETHVQASNLIYPLFVTEGEHVKKPVDSMPGIYQYSIDELDPVLEDLLTSGISGVLMFGIPDHKDELGSEAYHDHGITQRAITYIKEKCPELLVIGDVCLCEYTSHGHCGMLVGDKIDNDSTLPLLAKTAVSLAKAGADIVAPSDMMDGRVGAIRSALDENGFEDIPVMAYSAKYASAYYGPFRDAAESAPAFGDRKTYQMDPANAREALRENRDDIEEGADLLIVKPALAYLDILRQTADHFDLPIAAYNVSGEYSMVKAAAANGWIDEKRIVMENMIAMKRAGADMIITYHALDVARWLKEDGSEY